MRVVKNKCYKRYFVTKAEYRQFEVYADTRKEALEMVQYKRSLGLAGSPTQKGFNTLIFNIPLEEYKVTPALKREKHE
jgi:hypothetical protein